MAHLLRVKKIQIFKFSLIFFNMIFANNNIITDVIKIVAFYFFQITRILLFIEINSLQLDNKTCFIDNLKLLYCQNTILIES